MKFEIVIDKTMTDTNGIKDEKIPQEASYEQKIDAVLVKLRQTLIDNKSVFERYPTDVGDELLNALDSLYVGFNKESHKTTPLPYKIDGKTHMVNIDDGIVPLMTEIWKAEIDTLNSCENNIPRDYVWIEFKDADHIERFLSIVFVDVKLTDSIIHMCNSISTGKKWIFPRDVDLEWDDETDIINNVGLIHSIRFPKTDLEFVLKQLTEFNKKQ